ncbi:MAG: hypothetical protein KIS91_03110, partial [Anaerolineae bacterium]|nr:hypothetical protein [Anaerolineae bacterium]
MRRQQGQVIVVAGEATRRRWGRWLVAAVAALLLLSLAGCGTQAAYIPEAVVILNPTPGAPNVYSAQVVAAPVPPTGPLPPYPPGPPPTGCRTIHVVQPGETVSSIAL